MVQTSIDAIEDVLAWDGSDNPAGREALDDKSSYTSAINLKSIYRKDISI